MRENNQKIKLLVLYDMLRNETDEDHPMMTPAICHAMGEKGIPCDRRTLVKDVELLNEMGFEVMKTNIGRSNAYYVAEREFSIPELKILIDAVQAASFIPKKKTDALVRKITDLSGKYQAEQLKSNILSFNNRKHTNESVYYTVGFLETAIREHKKASFFYFDLDESGEKVYRKDKKRYIVEPMALIYHEDNYYLVTYNPKYDARTNYRIDRMDQVDIEKETVSEKAILHGGELSDYTEQVFKMFGGEKCDVTLRFEKSLLGVIFDKFGEDTKVENVDDKYYQAKVTVQISPTFYGWIFQFANRMKIISPENVLKSYSEHFRLAETAIS